MRKRLMLSSAQWLRRRALNEPARIGLDTAALAERKAAVKEMRSRGMTLQAIGDEFEITRERVRQLLART